MDTHIRPLSKQDLLPYASFAVNDAQGTASTSHVSASIPIERIRFVVWQCGFEPMVVLVYSYLPGCTIDDDEAIELATDLLAERKWFSGEPTEPDMVL